ncbi:MAG TPA: hypothetical protein ACFYD0_04830, partial [Candidatus Wunengus sp. YC65]|uniref:hypothetical protein n=1 Tax=Candidatus Wunengus sp. YC65 TaxID=3367701 RepID=UPI00402A593E
NTNFSLLPLRQYFTLQPHILNQAMGFKQIPYRQKPNVWVQSRTNQQKVDKETVLYHDIGTHEIYK